MFTIHLTDSFSAEVRGNGDVVDDIRTYYQDLVTTGSASDPDMQVEVWSEEPDPERVLGDPLKYYGRTGDEFIIRDGRNFLTLDRDWSVIRTAPNTGHVFVSFIIEYQLRKQLAERGRALLHASGVQRDGDTILFPAWRSSGKTNTLFSLLRDGDRYLADDRLWVEGDGTALGYPLAINMAPQNFDSFPHLNDTSTLEEARIALSDSVYEYVDVERSFVDRVVYFLNKFYLEPEAEEQVLHIRDLFPGSDYVERADVDSLVFLRTSLDDGDLSIRELPTDAAVRNVTSVSFYEWNKRLTEYCRAFDILFTSRNETEQLETLIEREMDVFTELVSNRDTYLLHVPREQQWSEQGIPERVKQKLDSL